MGNTKKWLIISLVILILLFTLLNSAFIFISAAFYRGSLITNMESQDFSASELENIQKEYSTTGILTITHMVLTAAIVICGILILTFFKKRSFFKISGFTGIAVSCLAIAQIVIMKDSLIFMVISILGLVLGIVILALGFSARKSLQLD